MRFQSSKELLMYHWGFRIPLLGGVIFSAFLICGLIVAYTYLTFSNLNCTTVAKGRFCAGVDNPTGFVFVGGLPFLFLALYLILRYLKLAKAFLTSILSYIVLVIPFAYSVIFALIFSGDGWQICDEGQDVSSCRFVFGGLTGDIISVLILLLFLYLSAGVIYCVNRLLIKLFQEGAKTRKNEKI
jgi:hypothetical protein